MLVDLCIGLDCAVELFCLGLLLVAFVFVYDIVDIAIRVSIDW